MEGAPLSPPGAALRLELQLVGAAACTEILPRPSGKAPARLTATRWTPQRLAFQRIVSTAPSPTGRGLLRDRSLQEAYFNRSPWCETGAFLYFPRKTEGCPSLGSAAQPGRSNPSSGRRIVVQLTHRAGWRDVVRAILLRTPSDPWRDVSAAIAPTQAPPVGWNLAVPLPSPGDGDDVRREASYRLRVHRPRQERGADGEQHLRRRPEGTRPRGCR